MHYVRNSCVFISKCCRKRKAFVRQFHSRRRHLMGSLAKVCWSTRTTRTVFKELCSSFPYDFGTLTLFFTRHLRRLLTEWCCCERYATPAARETFLKLMFAYHLFSQTKTLHFVSSLLRRTQTNEKEIFLAASRAKEYKVIS